MKVVTRVSCHRLVTAPTPVSAERGLFIGKCPLRIRLWRTGQAYQIPYRSLTPKAEEATNLLIPGAASFSHVAYCTFRLVSVWMIAGHAAGVAAATAARSGGAVQTIDVPALQERLRAQRQVLDFVPGQPERFEKSSVAGSSVKSSTPTPGSGPISRRVTRPRGIRKPSKAHSC